MTKASILEPGKPYTFRNYFEMAYEPDDILAEFDVTLERRSLLFSKAMVFEAVLA